MKFKMAPNSGFAILLRSPWWVSFAIAAVIVLLCGALLPWFVTVSNIESLDPAQVVDGVFGVAGREGVRGSGTTVRVRMLREADQGVGQCGRHVPPDVDGAARRGQADGEEAAAGGEGVPDLLQRRGGVEVVQHGDHGDEVDSGESGVRRAV